MVFPAFLVTSIMTFLSLGHMWVAFEMELYKCGKITSESSFQIRAFPADLPQCSIATLPILSPSYWKKTGHLIPVLQQFIRILFGDFFFPTDEETFLDVFHLYLGKSPNFPGFCFLMCEMKGLTLVLNNFPSNPFLALWVINDCFTSGVLLGS